MPTVALFARLEAGVQAVPHGCAEPQALDALRPLGVKGESFGCPTAYESSVALVR
jgi:hypothetical protein